MTFSSRLVLLVCVETALTIASVSMEPVRRLKVVPATSRSIEEIYLEARKFNAKTYVQPEVIDREIKKNIYLEIFNNDILKFNFETVNMDRPPRISTLPQHVWEELSDATNSSFMGLMSRYTYGSKPRTVRLSFSGQNVPENAFLCLALKPHSLFRDAGTLHVFYISDEYNMNLMPNRRTAGRFIFQLSAGRELVVRYLAEEPAKVIETSRPVLEQLYLDTRRNTEPAKREEDDSLCKLQPELRAQICFSIFHSSYFEHMTKNFFYNMAASTACAQQKVSFEYNNETDAEHEEWMLWCPAFFLEERSFFISRGDEPNNVFVYAYTRHHAQNLGKYYLANLSTNVRNVTEGIMSSSNSTGNKEPAHNSSADHFQPAFSSNPPDDVVESAFSHTADNNDDDDT